MRKWSCSRNTDRSSGPVSANFRSPAVCSSDAGPPRVTADPAASLDRRLGPFDAAAIVVSNVIGGGIFFVPVIVANLLPDPRAVLFVWALGGALAFAGAMAYAELAALRPKAGGEYVYLREAYHPAVAFVYGWGLLLVTQTAGMAAVAVIDLEIEPSRYSVCDVAGTEFSRSAIPKPPDHTNSPS